MIVYIIGLLVCLLCIFILKNTVDNYTNQPILKIWILLVLIVSSLTPIFNLIIGIIILLIIILSYLAEGFKLKNNKIGNFLNKKI